MFFSGFLCYEASAARVCRGAVCMCFDENAALENSIRTEFSYEESIFHYAGPENPYEPEFSYEELIFPTPARKNPYVFGSNRRAK